MQTHVTDRQAWDVETDLLVVPIRADGEPDPALAELDRRLDGALAAYRTLGEQVGKAHAATIIRGREMGAAWVMAVGIGKLTRLRPAGRPALRVRRRATARGPARRAGRRLAARRLGRPR